MMRKGFTLVELVVVIMILGILAAVAAPKLFKSSATASDNGLKQTLAVIRDRIELYAAENGGAMPGADGTEATFKANLAPYLRGSFPACPVPPSTSTVNISTQAPSEGEVGDGTGWRYNYLTGDFRCNSQTATASDPSIDYCDL